MMLKTLHYVRKNTGILYVDLLCWPSWLTYSGRFTRVNGYHSAAGPVWTSESSTTELNRRYYHNALSSSCYYEFTAVTNKSSYSMTKPEPSEGFTFVLAEYIVGNANVEEVGRLGVMC